MEQEVYNEFLDVNAGYRNKMRRLFLNLKDKNNPQLRESIVSGDLPVAKFCTMSVQVCGSRGGFLIAHGIIFYEFLIGFLL